MDMEINFSPDRIKYLNSVGKSEVAKGDFVISGTDLSSISFTYNVDKDQKLRNDDSYSKAVRVNDSDREFFRSDKNLSQPFTNLGCEFRPILSCLTLFANSPLSFNKRTKKFELIWLSKRTLIVLCVALLVVAAWILYLVNLVFDTNVWSSVSDQKLLTKIVEFLGSLGPSKSIVLLSFRVMFLFFPLMQISELVCEWVQAPLLAQLLNRWPGEFEGLFLKCFYKVLTQSPKSEYEYSCYINIPPNIFCPVTNGPAKVTRVKLANAAVVLLILFTSLLSIVSILKWTKPDFVDGVVRFYFVLRLFTMVLVDDVKNIFLYRDITEAFYMIQTGIKQVCKSGKGINSQDVKNWRDLIGIVRAQVELAAKYQTPSQLFFIIRLIVTTTGFFFIALNLPWQNQSANRFMVTWSLFYTVQLFRTYVKTLSAQQLQEQERQLGHELDRIDTSALDLATCTQIGFTRDVIWLNPSRISFGQYVTLNKRFLLTVFQQIVTYLIAMMQFVQSNSNNQAR